MTTFASPSIPNRPVTPVPPPSCLDVATLQMAVEAVAELILVIDTNRVVRYCNSAAERMLGVPREELIGQSWSNRRWHTTLIDGRPVPQDQKSDYRALEHGEASYGLERRIIRPDCSTVLVSGNTVPLRDADGRVTGLVVTLSDITQRVRAEERLRHAQKMEAVGKLAGGIAHDFNNLLTAIIGNIAVVRRDVPCQDPNHSLLEECEKAGWQAADLTKRLLNFARQRPQQFVPCLVSRIVDDTVAILRASLPASAEISVCHQPDLWCISGDPGQLFQLVLNFCTNARDAIEEAGRITIQTANVRLDRTVTVGQSLIPPGEFVRLTVSDTGCGMTPEVRDRMFEPFFTTKPMGKGTGLGLAVVFGIVQSHGAYFACESEPGRGATMTVFFPRERLPTGAAPTD